MSIESTSGWPAMSFEQAGALLTAAGAPFEMQEVEVHGVRLRMWKNAFPTLREAFLQGRSFGGRTFLVYEGERVDFDAFAHATIKLSHALIKLGVKKGDRVAIAMRNLPEWPVAFYAAMLAGAIVTPLNAWWLGHELEYGLTDSGSSVLIADEDRLARLEPHLAKCPALRHVILARSARVPGSVQAQLLSDIIGSSERWREIEPLPLPDVPLAPDDVLSILFTSGTTGFPKGALSTHRNVASAVLSGGFAAARTYLRRGQRPPSYDPKVTQRVMLLAMPLFHANGCYLQLLVALITGAKIVMMRRWDAEEALRLIERERVTSVGGVPTMAFQLVEHPNIDKYDLSSLESLSWGGAPAPPVLVRKVREKFPRAAPGNGWGMTETSGAVTSHGGEDYEHCPGSAGAVLPVWDIKIVGPDARELPTNEVGELWARGPGTIPGYWNKPAASAETFVDGWIKSGDLARVDADGYLFIVDRAKDMLIRGGENIYCVEVENALYEHPAVIDAAVVPIAHRMLGEVPGAIVHLEPSASTTEEELRAFVGARIAAFKVPVKIAFFTERLPRNAVGKILKVELRKVFAEITD